MGDQEQQEQPQASLMDNQDPPQPLPDPTDGYEKDLGNYFCNAKTKLQNGDIWVNLSDGTGECISHHAKAGGRGNCYEVAVKPRGRFEKAVRLSNTMGNANVAFLRLRAQHLGTSDIGGSTATLISDNRGPFAKAVKDPDQVLLKYFELCKPSGTIAIYTPAEAFGYDLDLLEDWLGDIRGAQLVELSHLGIEGEADGYRIILQRDSAHAYVPPLKLRGCNGKGMEVPRCEYLRLTAEEETQRVLKSQQEDHQDSHGRRQKGKKKREEDAEIDELKKYEAHLDQLMEEAAKLPIHDGDDDDWSTSSESSGSWTDASGSGSEVSDSERNAWKRAMDRIEMLDARFVEMTAPDGEQGGKEE